MATLTPGAGDGGRDDPTFRDWLDLLRRHWTLALAVFVLVFGAALASTWLTDPVYRASSDVLLRTEQSQQLFPRTARSTAQGLDRAPLAELEFTSSETFQEAARVAGGRAADVEVRLDTPESSILRFVAEGSVPDSTAAAADAWASTYVSLRHELDLERLRQLREVLVAERDAAAEEQRRIAAPVENLDEVISQTTDTTELSRLLNQRLIVQRSLSAELDPVEDRLRRLNAQLADVEVDMRVLDDAGASAVVSSEATVPTSRTNGSWQRNAVVGLVSGVLLAAAAVAAMRGRELHLRRRTSGSPH